MVEITLKMTKDGAERLAGTVCRRRAELIGRISQKVEDGDFRLYKDNDMLEEMNEVLNAIYAALGCENENNAVK